MHTGIRLTPPCRRPVANESLAVQLSLRNGDADGLPSELYENQALEVNGKRGQGRPRTNSAWPE